MPRLIEVQDAQAYFTLKAIVVGDVLLFHASGGHVHGGPEVIELLGSFVSAVVGSEGHVLTPVGAPNTVLFRAVNEGEAQIDIITGDAFHGPRKTALQISVTEEAAL